MTNYSNSRYATQPGTFSEYVGPVFTGDGAGSVIEIEKAFARHWHSAQIVPSAILVSAEALISLTKAVLYSPESSVTFAFCLSNGEVGSIYSGPCVSSYIHKYSRAPIPIRVDPALGPREWKLTGPRVRCIIDGVTGKKFGV